MLAWRGGVLRRIPELASAEEASAAGGGRAAAAAVATSAAAAAAVALAAFQQRRSSARSTRLATARPSIGTAAAANAELAMPPVWVINLDVSVDRWRQCGVELAAQDVEAERFSATLGKAMTDEELAEKVTWAGRYLCTPGMIGCFMSHARVWQRVVDEGHAAVVVLEDDIVLFEDFKGRLRTLLAELPPDWEVCLLGAVGCIASDTEAWYMKSYSLLIGGGRPSPGKTRSISPNVFVPYRPAGTHAYVISQQGARTLLRLCPKPSFHVDLAAWGQQELRLYCAKDFLATQRFGDDTTVSKHGAPLTKRFLDWCWEISGLAYMGRRGGIPNLSWAWTLACFTIPLPGRRRVIVELGPASSFFVILCLLSIPLRSVKPIGVAVLYFTCLMIIGRWLGGQSKASPVVILALIGRSLLRFG